MLFANRCEHLPHGGKVLPMSAESSISCLLKLRTRLLHAQGVLRPLRPVSLGRSIFER
jgi:hypothetical protein